MNVSDREWALPKKPWVMRMTWSDLLFAHWPVSPTAIQKLLPKGLEVDTFEGNAWIGVVPFLMSNVSPRLFPDLPGLSRFLELNVRTYVVQNGKPGVWFFSLDAANPIAVRTARATFRLPYMHAKMSIEKDAESRIYYKSNRTHRGEPPADFDASYSAIGETFLATKGTLEFWLTARYCLYSVNRQGHLFRGEIDHEPWRLSKADANIAINTMCQPYGLSLPEQPHCLIAQPIGVRAWWVEKCR